MVLQTRCIFPGWRDLQKTPNSKADFEERLIERISLIERSIDTDFVVASWYQFPSTFAQKEVFPATNTGGKA